MVHGVVHAPGFARQRDVSLWASRGIRSTSENTDEDMGEDIGEDMGEDLDSDDQADETDNATNQVVQCCDSSQEEVHGVAGDRDGFAWFPSTTSERAVVCWFNRESRLLDSVFARHMRAKTTTVVQRCTPPNGVYPSSIANAVLWEAIHVMRQPQL
jgi:hypothetical protein